MEPDFNSRSTFIKCFVAIAVIAVSLCILLLGDFKIDIEDESSGEFTEDEVSSEESSEVIEFTPSIDTEGLVYIPGTYTAKAAGISSDVQVTCTFDENGFTSIDLDVSGETDGIGADIGEEMMNQFLEAQSADVDGVSGATITSNALKEALENCIIQAAGLEETPEAETDIALQDSESQESAANNESGLFIPGVYVSVSEGYQGPITVSATFTENKLVGVSYDLSVEDDEIGSVIGPEISQEILNTQSAEVDSVTGATVTSSAFKEAIEDCFKQADSSASSIVPNYAPGVYSATAEGNNGTITVSLEFSETSIVSVSYDLSVEDDDIGAAIGPEISKQILSAQSAEIDGVSGATVTSEAVKSAVSSCIEQALES